MSLLDKLLKKRNIKSEDDLSPEERALFDSYKLILSGETVSTERIREFCQYQIKQIQTKFAEEKGSSVNDVYYKACLHVYTNIIKAIDAPLAEREAVERHLNQLISLP